MKRQRYPKSQSFSFPSFCSPGMTFESIDQLESWLADEAAARGFPAEVAQYRRVLILNHSTEERMRLKCWWCEQFIEVVEVRSGVKIVLATWVHEHIVEQAGLAEQCNQKTDFRGVPLISNLASKLAKYEELKKADDALYNQDSSQESWPSSPMMNESGLQHSSLEGDSKSEESKFESESTPFQTQQILKSVFGENYTQQQAELHEYMKTNNYKFEIRWKAGEAFPSHLVAVAPYMECSYSNYHDLLFLDTLHELIPQSVASLPNMVFLTVLNKNLEFEVAGVAVLADSSPVTLAKTLRSFFALHEQKLPKSIVGDQRANLNEVARLLAEPNSKPMDTILNPARFLKKAWEELPRQTVERVLGHMKRCLFVRDPTEFRRIAAVFQADNTVSAWLSNIRKQTSQIFYCDSADSYVGLKLDNSKISEFIKWFHEPGMNLVNFFKKFDFYY